MNATRIPSDRERHPLLLEQPRPGEERVEQRVEIPLAHAARSVPVGLRLVEGRPSAG